MDSGIKVLWLLAGLASVAIGAIGVVVPLLPTTPFLLVAAFAFARSSTRLNRWLREHRSFGPLIHNELFGKNGLDFAHHVLGRPGRSGEELLQRHDLVLRSGGAVG